MDFQVAKGDFLKIYDGEYHQNNLFGEFTNTEHPPTSFFTRSSEVNLDFLSQRDSPGAPGFRVVYHEGETKSSHFYLLVLIFSVLLSRNKI